MNNKLFKRLLSLLVVVVMVMTMLPTVFAEDPNACPAHTGVTEWTEIGEGAWIGGTLESGHYKLTCNQTLALALYVAEGATVCIDLAGYNITADASKDDPFRAFEVNGELTITDSAETDGVISGGHMEGTCADKVAVHIYGGNILVSGAAAKLNLYGGVISDGYMKAGDAYYHIYGGNIGLADGAEMNIYGGTVKDGKIEAPQQSAYYQGGGNIYANASAVNIYGGTVSGGDMIARYSSGSKDGRKVYAAGGNISVVNGTFYMEAGLVDDGNLDVLCNSTNTANNPTSTAYALGGNVYCNGSTVTIKGGVISNGTLSGEALASGTGKVTLEAHGGNLYIKNCTAEIKGNAQILDGEVVNDYTSARGGNLFVSSGTVTMSENAVLSGGTCSTGGARGGNVFATGTFNINGGTISNGTAGWGSNLMLQSGATVNLNGGSITGGNGDPSVLVQRGTFNMTAGTIENTEDGKAAVSVEGTTDTNGGKAYISGGTVGDVDMNRASLMEVTGGTIGAAGLLHTATLNLKAGATVSGMWDVAETAAVTVAEGVVCQGFNPALNGVEGFEAYLMKKTEGKPTNYILYSKLGTALAAAQAGNTVSLMSDVTADEVVVPAGVTLNLYGSTLTANSVSSASEGAQIKDSRMSVSGAGKIVSDSVTVYEDNAFLPVAVEDGYVFEEVAFAENLAIDGNKATYKFYVNAEAASTMIDDAILAGNGVSIDVYVTWKDAAGVGYEQTFTLGTELLEQYAGAWNTKMIVLTINGVDSITDLDCTAQIVSGGVIVGA